MIVYILAAAAVAFLIWYAMKPAEDLARLGNKMPGPPSYPVVGCAYMMPKTGPEILDLRRKLIEDYGRVVRFWMGNRLMVLLSDAQDCEVILRDRKQLHKSMIYEFFHPWLGLGLLTSTGNKWFQKRKAITPAFHFKILEQFLDVFNKNGDILIQCLKKPCGSGPFDIKPYISAYALDVICETAMGSKVEAQLGKGNVYFDAVRNMCQMLSFRIKTIWLYSDFMFKLLGYKKRQDQLLDVLHGMTNKVINEKQKEYDVHEYKELKSDEMGIKNKTAFLELLLKMKNEGVDAFSTNKDIREEVDTFMFEGHDTTTSAICFALNTLVKYPEVQERIYDEVSKIENNHFTNEDLQEMKYLEMVIKECLRLYPSVPVIGRQLTEELKIPSGYTLPAGCLIMISIYDMHRNKDHFANPLEFNPDNFLPDVASKRHPYAYIPFSAGPRNCIGQKFAMMEMKSVLAKIIRNFKLARSGDAWAPLLDPDIVLLSLNGHEIKLVAR